MPKNQTNSHTTQHKSRIFFSDTATFIYNLCLPNAMPHLYPFGQIHYPAVMGYKDCRPPNNASSRASLKKAGISDKIVGDTAKKIKKPCLLSSFALNLH